MADLPELPEDYFFRIGERWFFGPMVQVQIRRRWKLGPLRWSTRETVGMSTQELMSVGSDEEVAAELARRQAEELYRYLRPVRLGTLRGDH